MVTAPAANNTGVAVPRFVLSVDVEDYFQVEAFAGIVNRAEWDRWPSRVVGNTHRCLDLCDEFGAQATYFVLGWVAQKFPGLVREIQERGHEIACHSFWHRPVYSLTPDTFRQDLRDARMATEDAAGVALAGYRAPSWSITRNCLWALDILAEEGFTYDSSIFPIRHDLYGYPGAQRMPYEIQKSGQTLMEYPPATVRLLGRTLPAAGGGYLRIFPLAYTNWAIHRLAAEDGRAVVVYFHPWELDPEQPRIAGPLKSRFRHYTNLGRMEQRLRMILARNRFQPFRDLASAAHA
jgi:polysaccharide deacetylase family protein (PEP-CTERM system associated)